MSTTEATPTGSRTRWRTLALALLAVMALAFAASCGGDSDESTDAESTGDSIAESVDDAVDDLESQAEDARGELDKALDDLQEGVEGVPEKLTDCAELATRWAALTLSGTTGASADSIDEDSEELKKLLPDDLHGDVDTITDSLHKIAEDGLLNAGEALGTAEYTEANDAISNYIESECT